MTIFMNIKHEEFEGQGTYDGVEVTKYTQAGTVHEKTRIFNTGNVPYDWNEGLAYARELIQEEDEYDRIMGLSSVDHFLEEEPQEFIINEETGHMDLYREEANV